MNDRILDAALALAAASGLRHLTMDEVARRAGVGRMTVYRRFGDRAGLVEALRAREAGRFLAEMDAASAVDAPIEEQVAAGFATALRLSREHPLLNRLARIEPDSVVQALREGLFATCRAYLAGRLEAAQAAGRLAPGPVEPAAELLVRLALSFVLIDDTVLPVGDDAAAREVARRYVAPVLAPP